MHQVRRFLRCFRVLRLNSPRFHGILRILSPPLTRTELRPHGGRNSFFMATCAGCGASNQAMNSARRLFLVAGIYGLLVILPQFFMEARVGRDYPPAITHAEYFYGFLGVAAAWQVAFLIIASDPLRHRLMMIPSALEKFSFAGAVGVLYWQGRVPGAMAGFAAVDFVLGVLFLVAFRRLGRFE